ncbi:helix-turn-helix domain-containing protein [Nocardia pseudobrasiliensis]|uniref:Helix-turn-helix protein n=1 Tax=Nocardia pseudobrasiliensis TaxID=45979 RepID=A0A370IF65_9NOCA|nr:helix-turn-helix protein [Nocardia pseudobrasiliensis]
MQGAQGGQIPIQRHDIAILEELEHGRPHEWITQRRVDHARHLLEATELPINEVATAAGFADPILLRKHLRGTVGLTPNAYRRSYAAPQADPA